MSEPKISLANVSDFKDMRTSLENASKTMTDSLNYVLSVIEQKAAQIPDGNPIKDELNKLIKKVSN